MTNEHDKRREWWVGITENGFGKWLSEHESFAAVGEYECVKKIHVREVRPGEITLTREELHLIQKKYHKMDRLLDAKALEAELFPEGTEVGGE